MIVSRITFFYDYSALNKKIMCNFAVVMQRSEIIISVVLLLLAVVLAVMCVRSVIENA